MPFRPVYQEPGFGRQTLAALLGSVRGLMIGVFMAYVSVGFPSFDADENAPFEFTETEKSLVSSIPFLTAIGGSLLASPLMARTGRKTILWMSLIPTGVTWVMIALSPSFSLMLTAAGLNGVLAGLVMPVGQLYLAEISSSRTRGFISAATMVSQVASMLIVYLVGSIVNWQTLALFNAVLISLLVPVGVWVPESPAWLLAHDTDDTRATAALMQLRGGNRDVKLEFDELRAYLDASSAGHALSMREVFRWKYMKPIAILVVFAILRQFTGALAISSNTVDIFESVGGGSFGPMVSTCIVGAVQLVFVLVAVVIVDKVGRKTLVVGSGITMGLAHLVFAFYYYALTHDHFFDQFATTYSWIPLAALIVFTAGFSLGFAPVFFILMGELIPRKAKSVASGLVSIVNNIATWAVFQFYFMMKHGLTEAGSFGFYGAVSLLAALFCFVCLPETRGKSLSELEQKITRSRKKKNKPGMNNGLGEDASKTKVSVAGGNSVCEVRIGEAPISFVNLSFVCAPESNEISAHDKSIVSAASAPA